MTQVFLSRLLYIKKTEAKLEKLESKFNQLAQQVAHSAGSNDLLNERRMAQLHNQMISSKSQILKLKKSGTKAWSKMQDCLDQYLKGIGQNLTRAELNRPV